MCYPHVGNLFWKNLIKTPPCLIKIWDEHHAIWTVKCVINVISHGPDGHPLPCRVE